MPNDSNIQVKLKLLGSQAFNAEARRSDKALAGLGNAADRTGRDMRGMARASTQGRRAVDHYGRSSRNAARDSNRLHASMRATAGGFRLIGGGASAIAAVGGIVATGSAVRKMAEEYQEARKTAALTRATIKSTNAAAGVSARHVDRLANRLSRKTAVDDEQIASSENLLLTFKNIKRQGGIFDRATVSALDLSAHGFGSISGASKMLGKALNDPIKGVSALGRAGVTFSDKQKTAIKRMVETGHALRAQRTIMREVESQVKGSAASQATPVDRLRTNYANLAETLGTLGAPTANRGIGTLARYTRQLDHIAGRKDIDLGTKLRLSEKAAVKTFGPLVREGRRAVERMHLDEKLENAVEWAMPKIAEGFAHGAPRAAAAFVHGFAEADIWGKLVIGGLLWRKMGGRGAWAMLGSRAAGGFGGGFSRGPGRSRRNASQVAATVAPAAAAAGTGAGVARRTASDLEVSSLGRKASAIKTLSKTAAIFGPAAAIAADSSTYVSDIGKASVAVKVYGDRVAALRHAGDRAGLKRLAADIRNYATVNQSMFWDAGKAVRGYASRVEHSLDGVNLDMLRAKRRAIDTVSAVTSAVNNAVAASAAANAGRLPGRRPGRHAAGGVVRTPYQVVGERGPELAALPMGTRVYTATETRQMTRDRPRQMLMPPGGDIVLHATLTAPDGSVLHRETLRFEQAQLDRR